MRIYPDPELPDVKVEWLDADCRSGDEIVFITLDSEDSTHHQEQSIACTSIKATFKDVKRERYKIKGELRTPEGEPITPAEYEVDLRNGFDESAFLYFGAYDDFRIAWNFDMGATCDSLGVQYVSVTFSDEFAYSFICPIGIGTGNAPDGDFSVKVTAYNNAGNPVAETPAADVTIDSTTLTNLGTFTLYPLP